MFKAQQSAEDFAAAKEAVRKIYDTANANPGDRFYAALYLGLVAEARGETAESAMWVQRAIDTREYAASGDYMYALAKVHAKLRAAEARS